MNQPLLVAYGMGVDSTAMLVGLAQRGIRPDAILFADTVSEKDETYAYLPIINEWCRKVGFPEVTVVEYVVKNYKNWPPYLGLEENCLTNGTLPSEAFGMGSCSEKWKQQPQNNWTKAWAPAVEIWAQGGKVKKAIGYDDSTADKKRSCSADRTFKVTPDDRYDYWYPLQEWHWDRVRCVEEIKAAGLPVPPKSSCFYCLDGSEEVETPDGPRPIREMVGEATLLVPRPKTSLGEWRKVRVSSFGRQPIMKIRLRRGKTLRTVLATPEHRWPVKHPKTGCWEKWTTTMNLRKGDRIPSCRVVSVKASRHPILPSPFGIAHGFVYGDGSFQSARNSPASVVLHGKKDASMIKYFKLCRHRGMKTANGKTATYVYDLPRLWKELPSLKESKGYLLGWLAGYFAADGTVTPSGAAVLYSSVRKNIAFVRIVCALLGVQTGGLSSRMRDGFGKRTRLHSVSIRPNDLPREFWLAEKHRERALRPRKDYDTRFRDWEVLSSRNTSRTSEVYCAVVPGVEMFTLADGLVTGNCPNMKAHEVDALPKDKLARIVIMEARAKVRLEGHMTQDQLDEKYQAQLAAWQKKANEAREKGLELPRAPKQKTAGAKPLMRGLWRNKMMTDHIVEKGLLARATVERLAGQVPTELVRRNEAHARGEKVETWDEFMDRVLVDLN